MVKAGGQVTIAVSQAAGAGMEDSISPIIPSVIVNLKMRSANRRFMQTGQAE
ncbi:MAG: hypothetical protein JSV99_09635 [Planctomycetota bacterium]|nr:MAG: hypothetical protein JSV99_09635 [Planctomycetota bacterium]